MKRFSIAFAVLLLLAVSVGCKQEAVTAPANVGPGPGAAGLQKAGEGTVKSDAGGRVGAVREATPPEPPPQ